MVFFYSIFTFVCQSMFNLYPVTTFGTIHTNQSAAATCCWFLVDRETAEGSVYVSLGNFPTFLLTIFNFVV